MISALDEWYETLYIGGLFLTAEQQQKMGDIVHKHLINYAYLADNALEKGLCRYNIVFKHHFFRACCAGYQCESAVPANLFGGIFCRTSQRFVC